MRDLIAGKRRWSSPPNRDDALHGFQGWHERGYIPHCDEPGLTQFVTFVLADAFPTNLRSEWAALLKIEKQTERRRQLQSYLDKGRGACHLKQQEIGTLVDQALRFHENDWYNLLAWVVMPNHVHVLFKTTSVSMSKTVREWKRYTSREANRLLGRSGQFWADDFWDTYIRDAKHEIRAVQYIEENPVKAFLVRDPRDWPWCSARFRDEYGMLNL